MAAGVEGARDYSRRFRRHFSPVCIPAILNGRGFAVIVAPIMPIIVTIPSPSPSSIAISVLGFHSWGLGF